MVKISYDQLKHLHELHKQVYYWAARNEFRNTIIEYEKVANYVWDIDSELGQPICDFVNKMYDAYYYNQNKLSEFITVINKNKVQIYSIFLCYYYSELKRLRDDSAIAIKLCQTSHTQAVAKAIALVEDMKIANKTLAIEYNKKLTYYVDYQYGQSSKLINIIQEYVGAVFKEKIIEFENGF